MPGPNAYAPAIWPTPTIAIFTATMGLYSWRRRSILRFSPPVLALYSRPLPTISITSSGSNSRLMGRLGWRVASAVGRGTRAKT